MSPFALATDPVKESLRRHLHEPVDYVLSLPSKGLRAQLVELGCLLSGGETEGNQGCAVAGAVIERIHAGSLIVDDIEDESVVRRNAPTLHLKYGLARALNAGNWLYFSPLTTLREMELDPATELQLHRECLETLSTAHCGQAIDLGACIDEVPQAEVPALCASSLEWKTGELAGLALRMGGYAAGASPGTREKLHRLGKELGVGLQMLDDVGNFTLGRGHAMAAKRREDLRQRRPSWIWCFAAMQLPAADYELWVRAVRALPDEAALTSFSARYDLAERARAAAAQHLRGALATMEQEFPDSAGARAQAHAFVKQMERSYAK